MSDTCPDALLEDLLERGRLNEIDLLQEVTGLLPQYPEDPRLHFLQGSLLAGGRQYGPAMQAMERAIEIAPDFAVARFQLGFLAFTSGSAGVASEAWQPLLERDPGDQLRLFVEGLLHLAADRFAQAAELIGRGIALGGENPAVTANMRMIVDEIERRESSHDAEDEPTSETQLALRQAEARKRKLN